MKMLRFGNESEKSIFYSKYHLHFHLERNAFFCIFMRNLERDTERKRDDKDEEKK